MLLPFPFRVIQRRPSANQGFAPHRARIFRLQQIEPNQIVRHLSTVTPNSRRRPRTHHRRHLLCHRLRLPLRLLPRLVLSKEHSGS
jgi:hypothetical protein